LRARDPHPRQPGRSHAASDAAPNALDQRITRGCHAAGEHHHLWLNDVNDDSDTGSQAVTRPIYGRDRVGLTTSSGIECFA
jgi:hypothetical protein